MKTGLGKGQAVSQNTNGSCASCKYALKLTITDDYLCSRRGIVDEDYKCKSYKINHLIKRPPRKRKPIDENIRSRFKKEDFSLV